MNVTNYLIENEVFDLTLLEVTVVARLNTNSDIDSSLGFACA